MALKGEINKEEMFRKIMPSSYLSPVDTAQAPNEETSQPMAETPAQAVAQPQATPEAAPAPVSQQPAEMPTQPVAQPQATPEVAPAPVLQQPAAEIPPQPMAQPQATPEIAPAPVLQQPAAEIPPQPVAQPVAATAPPISPECAKALDESLQIEPVNVAEILMERYYPRYMERLDACPCQRCRDDVFGMALNHIRPRYYPSNLITEDILQDRALITETVTQLLKALFLVKKSPHHTNDDLQQVQ